MGKPGATRATVVRRRVRIDGVVQGVGFRPFVHRLATALGVAGWVRNDAHGVRLEAEAAGSVVDAFLDRLHGDAPPLARIERLEVTPLPPRGERDFRIRDSDAGGVPAAAVAADSSTCDDCLAELFDPRDRRYRYPFINCTNCGPRFTIVCRAPYDRPNTTMAAFTMCAACRREYDDPDDRRFHAQPNACRACGPRAVLRPASASDEPSDPVAAAALALVAGEIVAVKGLGGYHLACRADDERAVSRLRARKHREEKPFALMVRSPEAAARLVILEPAAHALLTAPARPIVLARRKPTAPVAASVAPGAPELGVMLAYTPLHHLLLAALETTGVTALVMTSGNVSDEPIAFEDDDAIARLAPIADHILTHDRPIRTRTDDSVARVVDVGGDARVFVLRRSRGWVPERLDLPRAAPRPLLACGADLKNTFCLAKGTHAWVGPHIGDLETEASLRAFHDGIAHHAHLFAVEPEAVAHDLHPDFHSTRFAERLGLPRIAVQHHHAHLAACLAENDEPGPALGVIFDGMGYGPDGTVWGGEFLAGDLRGFERLGHLRTVALPGGDRAAREPWRMACAWLQEIGANANELPPPLAGRIDSAHWRAVTELARTRLAARTSSVGRLFDAVAALCGLRTASSYEGQAAIELEAAADPGDAGTYATNVEDLGGLRVLDPRQMLREIVADLDAGVPASIVSARFHDGLATATAELAAELAARHSLERIVLSGGVFQNRRLLRAVAHQLRAMGRTVLLPRRLPINDGGIAYGQAAVAAARLAADAVT